MWRRNAPLLAVAGLALASCGDNLADPPLLYKHVVDPEFRSEGVTVFDVNRDRHPDLVTEEQWYEGPTFAPHPIREPRAWDPLTEYAHCFGAFHTDVDRDGFDDLIVFGPPGEAASWCANPAGAIDQPWTCHDIAPMASGESPMLADVFLDANLSLVMGIEPDRILGLVRPDPGNPTLPWVMHPVTDPGFPQAARYEHGLGLGDIDGDGFLDLVTGSGWLEHPDDEAAVPWRWHPVDLCPNDCAHMFVHDFDGDGRADVIGTSPHAYGVRWWRQLPRADDAEPAFEAHLIDDSISQTHAARLADLDGDGRPELVTGKRWFAHFDQDPGALEPAMLVVYKYYRNPASVGWERIIVDDDSGVGSQFHIADVDGDARLDIVVSNKKGLSYFSHQP